LIPQSYLKSAIELIRRLASTDLGIPQNVFIVGLMGAGKTSVGKLLAKRLNKTFFDTDLEIEHRTGVNISMIFEIEGESGFRKRETAILKELTSLKGIVLATGGGAVLSEENRTRLSKNGVVIYLRATINELLRRVRHDKKRPLLQTTQDRSALLSELLARRDPLYKEIADIIVDTGRQNPGSLALKLEHDLANIQKNDVA
jgi:shikimate kinase